MRVLQSRLTVARGERVSYSAVHDYVGDARLMRSVACAIYFSYVLGVSNIRIDSDIRERSGDRL